jgi:hypothetical protein
MWLANNNAVKISSSPYYLFSGMTVEAAFEAATFYLQDRSADLAPYISVPPLLHIIKGYYCSTILFENAIFSMPQDRNLRMELAKLVAASKDKAVAAWRERALVNQIVWRRQTFPVGFFQENEEYSHRLCHILEGSFHQCSRPDCWYFSACTCGWPLIHKISPAP